jgi:DNA polymerase-3 subunit beta
MKFSADRKSLSEVLSQIQGITGRKTNLSITSDVLIKVSGSEVTLTANDLETVFQGTYQADIESDGIISINARKLFEIVREYPDTTLPITEIENRWVEIGCDNVIFHIVSSDYDNFPETPVIEDIRFVEVESAVFRKMVEVVSSISYGQDEKRIYVLGVLLEPIEDEAGRRLRMVSTDSRRLTAFDIEYQGEFTVPADAILIPKKGLSELSKFLNREGRVKIGVKDNHFIVRKANETVMIKLLDGEYPDYRRVISTEGMTAIDMDRSLLLMVMKRMSILASDDYKSILLNFRENELTVTITNPEIGESKEEILIGYTGESFETAFNPRYFIDALNAIESASVLVNIRDKKSPCILRGTSDHRMICAIMAMSV